MDETPANPRTKPEPGREWAALMHDLGTPLTVAVGRLQLTRRHLRRGNGVAQADTDLEALEAAVARLVAAVHRLDQDHRSN